MLLDLFHKLHLSQLEKAQSILEIILSDVTDTDFKTYRDNGDGWTVLEVLCHLRDFEAVFLERAHLTVTQDNPPLPFPDPDTLATEKNYNDDNPAGVLTEWLNLRQEHHAFLSTRAESDWTRVADHPTRGAFTLNDQLLLTVWHDSNHIEQILRILKGKHS